MKTDRTLRIFVGVIAFILAVAALKVGKPILLPVLFSVFLALLLMPVIHGLRYIKVPIGLAAFISLFLVLGIVFLLADIIQLSLIELINKLPDYQERLNRQLDPLLEKLAKWEVLDEVDPDKEPIFQLVDAKTIAGVLGNSVVSFFSFASNLVIIFFVTLFVLTESQRLKEKVIRAYGLKTTIPESLREIGKDIQRYIFLKTLISVTTGCLVYVLLEFMDLDFALLWGFLAFCLNFVPNFGSIVATLPPVLLAMIQYDKPFWPTFWILLGLGTIQVLVGNLLDPRIMGKGLHVSPLVVFLSMLFFGWLWGFTGMVLAVPLMVTVKVIISHQEGMREINILLEG